MAFTNPATRRANRAAGISPNSTAAERLASVAASAFGRLGGQAGTKAQNQARKQNAQQAGRPRRVCTHCGEPVVGGHADRSLDETCGAHGWRWQKQSEK